MNEYEKLHKAASDERSAWGSERDDIKKVEDCFRLDRRSAKSGKMMYSPLVPMTESAMASIVPPDLKVTVSRKPGDIEEGVLLTADDDEKWLFRASKSQDWISEFRSAVSHALTTGRSVFYVSLLASMGSKKEVPTIRTIPYDEVVWPMATPRQRELPWVARFYKAKASMLVKLYPERKGDIDTGTDSKMVELVEVTDIENRCKVLMFTNDRTKEPLEVSEGEDFWNPWVIAPLIANGVDLLGVSPFRQGLKLSNRISRLYERFVRIGDMQVPSLAVDSSQIGDPADIAKLSRAKEGDMIPIGFTDVQTTRPLFQLTPVPEIPQQLFALLQMLETALAYLTGISSTARGQTVGAKTATEMTLIDSMTRGLAQMRQQALYDAFCKASAKALMLHKGVSKDQDDNEETLNDLMEVLTVTAASSSELNRMVISEKFMGAYQVMKGNPAFNQDALNKFLVTVNQLPEDLLAATPEQIQGAIQAGAQVPGLLPGQQLPGQEVPPAQETVPPDQLPPVQQ